MPPQPKETGAAMTSPTMFATFQDAWAGEFITSVEMFTGATVVVDTEPVDPEGFASERRVWHEQSFTREGTATLWVGVPLSRCLVLTSEATTDETEGLSLYRELLSQSLQAAAQVLNTGALPGMRCATTFTTEAPPASATSSTVATFRLGSQLIPITFRYDDNFDALMGPLVAVAEPTASPAAPAHVAPATEPDLPSELERFVGVDLPVRVVLGRATLRLRDILKLTVGSLIELDARPGDLADVCVHDSVLARGEVVSIRGNYGVRIANVMSERDRLTLQLRGRRRPPVLDGRGRPERVH
jgi:flagellar motor switch protein FliN/FliY